jgi:hypothetical protein
MFGRTPSISLRMSSFAAGAPVTADAAPEKGCVGEGSPKVQKNAEIPIMKKRRSVRVSKAGTKGGLRCACQWRGAACNTAHTQRAMPVRAAHAHAQLESAARNRPRSRAVPVFTRAAAAMPLRRLRTHVDAHRASGCPWQNQPTNFKKNQKKDANALAD